MAPSTGMCRREQSLSNYRCQIRHAISILLQLTDDALPGPEGREDGPPRPRLQDAVQLEGVEDGEDEEAAEHHELGRVEVLQRIENHPSAK